MQKKILCLLIFVLALASAFADPIQITIGGEKQDIHPASTVIDGVPYVPFAVLEALGAKATVRNQDKRDIVRVEVIPASGRKFECSGLIVENQPFVPIMKIASDLGVKVEYDKTYATLGIYAQIKNISFDGSELNVDTSIPVAFDLVWWGTAHKLILDIHGVRIPIKQSDISISNSTAIPIRTGVQGNGDTGRIVLDMPGDVRSSITSARKTSKIVISLSGLKESLVKPTISPNPTIDSNNGSSTSDTVQPVKPDIPPVTVSGIEYRKDGSNRVDIYVKSTGKMQYTTSLYRDPDRLVFNFQNAVLDKEINDISVNHKLLEGLHISEPNDKVVRVEAHLSRLVVYNVQNAPNGDTVIGLQLPKGAGGTLAKKIVVIDPGHGGCFPGAKACNGNPEKKYNLEIAKQLKNTLVNAGVCAFLTRENDSVTSSNNSLDLEARVDFAKHHSADFFISIHCNSCLPAGKLSGSQTYYHRGDMNGRMLAESVHAEFVKVSGLPNLRAQTDPGQDGYSVLRNSSAYGIPAILIEVGFINNSYDLAAIENDGFQKKITAAILKGLRGYVEGNNSDAPGVSSKLPANPINNVETKKEKVTAVNIPEPMIEPISLPISAEPQKSAKHLVLESKGPRRPGEDVR